MNKLEIDCGVQEYRIPGAGVLRFHPGDPNIYSRLSQAAKKLEQLPLDQTEDPIAAMEKADRELKALVNWVLGGENDVDQALGGISLLAVAKNGRTVAENLFQALERVLRQGAQQLAKARADAIRKTL